MHVWMLYFIWQWFMKHIFWGKYYFLKFNNKHKFFQSTKITFGRKGQPLENVSLKDNSLFVRGYVYDWQCRYWWRNGVVNCSTGSECLIHWSKRMMHFRERRPQTLSLFCKYPNATSWKCLSNFTWRKDMLLKIHITLYNLISDM